MTDQSLDTPLASGTKDTGSSSQQHVLSNPTQAQDAIDRLKINLKRLVQNIAKDIECDVVSLYLYDAKAEEFDLPVGYGHRCEEFFYDKNMLPGTDRGVGGIVHSKEPVIPFEPSRRGFLANQFVRLEGVVEAAGFPLLHNDQAVGVMIVSWRRSIEIVTFIKDIRQDIEGVCTRAGEEIARANDTEHVFSILSEQRAIPRSLPEQPLPEGKSLEGTLQPVAKLASQILDRPVAIWVLDRRTDKYHVRSSYMLPPSYRQQIDPVKAGDDSVISKIVATGESRFSYRRQIQIIGWTNVRGIPLMLWHQAIGVIEVFCSEHVEESICYDPGTLSNLAKVTATSIQHVFQENDFQQVRKAVTAVEAATAELSVLEIKLHEMGEDIKKLYFDFAAIQLIRREEDLIETVWGTGITKSLVSIARHPLSGQLLGDPSSKDIQADVAGIEPPHIEIIKGWDDRFDNWIYEKFGHDRLVRIWVPILIMRDTNGNTVKDWCRVAQWEWRPCKNRQDGWRKTMTLRLESDKKLYPYCIGTVEAGFEDSSKTIDPVLAKDLVKTVSKQALRLWESLPDHILESIVDEAKSVLGADDATLYFGGKPYRYMLYRGDTGFELLRKNQPRSQGLGEQALNEKKAVACDLEKGIVVGYRNLESIGSEEAVQCHNQSLYDRGIRTYAAFPLIVDEKRQGVLYLHFRHTRRFNEDEIQWGELFTRRAVDVLRHTSHYRNASDRAREMINLHAVTQSLVSELATPSLQDDIAGYAFSILTAYQVAIYDYSEQEDRFLSEPAVKGHTRSSQAPVSGTQIRQIIESRMAIYHQLDSSLREHAEFKHSLIKYMNQEGFPAFAGIPLLVAGETVGVMLILYRRKHDFSQDDQNIINTLAATAAIAIRNQRVLEQRQQDVMTITHQLGAPLISAVGGISAAQWPKLTETKRRERLESAKDMVEDVLAVSNGIFSALALDTGHKIPLENDEINLSTELHKLFKGLQLTNQRDDLRLVYPIAVKNLRIYLDRGVLGNVLYSQLHNVMKYADPDSEVYFDYTMDSISQRAILYINSVGEPIQPEEKDQIFQRFRRGKIIEQTGRHHGGTGLGLWVARKLMRAVGGDITLRLYPDEPRRAAFAIQLPETANPAMPGD